MEVVPNWHHIRIRFVRRLSSRIVDEQHIVVCCNRPSLRTINVNELDATIVQSIRLHHPNIPMEIGDQQVVHLQEPVSTVPGIMLAPNLFAIVEIIPKFTETNRKKETKTLHEISNFNLMSFWNEKCALNVFKPYFKHIQTVSNKRIAINEQKKTVRKNTKHLVLKLNTSRHLRQ